jgi:hypothetical protein
LGKVTDAEIARRLGMHRESVRQRRVALGIPRASLARRGYSNRALAESVLGALSRYELTLPHHVWWRVLEDYGTVCERQVYRVLRVLVAEGRVEHERYGGYRRRASAARLAA